MMQKKDYSMAYVSFKLSCDILKTMMFGEGNDEEIGSREAQERNINFGTMKFKLACRLFQKGLANFAILKVNYSNHDLLDKDFDFIADAQN